MSRFVTASTLAILLLLPLGPALAEDVSIKAFYGKWAGSAISNNRDSLYFGVTVRDMDVTISGAGDGFDIAWTTVMRRGGTPEKPDVRRKSTKLTFVASRRPGIYQVKGAGDPLRGAPYSWARVDGNTLIVYLLDIGDRGAYEIARYARTLTGGGMDLEFKLIRDGQAARRVRGKLVKISN